MILMLFSLEWIVKWNSLAATLAWIVVLYLKNVAANKCILFLWEFMTDFNIEPQVFIDAQPSLEIKRINS